MATQRAGRQNVSYRKQREAVSTIQRTSGRSALKAAYNTPTSGVTVETAEEQAVLHAIEACNGQVYTEDYLPSRRPTSDDAATATADVDPDWAATEEDRLRSEAYNPDLDLDNW